MCIAVYLTLTNLLFSWVDGIKENLWKSSKMWSSKSCLKSLNFLSIISVYEMIWSVSKYQSFNCLLVIVYFFASQFGFWNNFKSFKLAFSTFCFNKLEFFSSRWNLWNYFKQFKVSKFDSIVNKKFIILRVNSVFEIT